MIEVLESTTGNTTGNTWDDLDGSGINPVTSDNIYDVVELLVQKVDVLERQVSPVNRITGQEVATKEMFNGKTVYCKTINVGTLPNAGNKNVASGLNLAQVEVIKLIGIAKNASGTSIPLPNATPSVNYAIGCFVSAAGNVSLATTIDRSEYSGTVDIYYVYKNA